MLTCQIFGQLLLCADVSATVIQRTDRRTLSRCRVRCLALDCLCGFICPNAWSESYNISIFLSFRIFCPLFFHADVSNECWMCDRWHRP